MCKQATANGWSRSVLDHWIESDLYSRQGKAVPNFKRVLPPPQSDLANQIVRDPYNFDFLMLRDRAAERELESGLLVHIRKFLIELGAGFAFVGQQVRYTARLVEALPPEFRGSLPSPKELEEELGSDEPGAN